jgi:hypothetical protein
MDDADAASTTTKQMSQLLGSGGGGGGGGSLKVVPQVSSACSCDILLCCSLGSECSCDVLSFVLLFGAQLKAHFRFVCNSFPQPLTATHAHLMTIHTGEKGTRPEHSTHFILTP